LFYFQVLTEGKNVKNARAVRRVYQLQALFIFSLILIGSLEIMDKFVEEGVLLKIGKESYAINKDKVDFFLNWPSPLPIFLVLVIHSLINLFLMKLQRQNLQYEFTIVKEEIDGQLPKVFDKALQVEDRLYMKVRFYFSLYFFVFPMRIFDSLLTCNLYNVCSQRMIWSSGTEVMFLWSK